MTAPKCPFVGDERKGASDAANIMVSVTAGEGSLGGETIEEEPGERCCMNRAQQKLHLLEKSVSAATTRVWPSVKCLFSLWDKQCLSHGPAWSPPSGCHS